MMRRIVLAIAAMSCAAMTAGAQARPRKAPVDSALLALTLDAATRVVTPYTSGDRARPPGGWVLALAPEIPDADGSRIASELRRQLTLRDTTVRDSTRTIVTIHSPRITADSFHVWISVGNWFSCPRVDATVETTFEINGVRRDDGWTWTRPSEMSRSIATACRETPQVIEMPAQTGRGRRGGGGGGGGGNRGGNRGGSGGSGG